MDSYGQHAHDESQEYYNGDIPSEFLDDAYKSRIRDLKSEMDDRLYIERKHHSKTKRRVATAGGAAIGAGIGYAIGNHYAKRTPIISQQRKRKIVGTVVGGALGAAAGYKVGDHLREKDIEKSFKKIKADYSNQAWAETARYHKAKEVLNQRNSRKSNVESVAQQGNSQIDKFNKRFGRFTKK